MIPPTTAARAAAARTRRRAGDASARAVHVQTGRDHGPRTHDGRDTATPLRRDPCPSCNAELSRPHGASRRLVVFTSDPGVFGWQCPECRGTWTEPASAQSGSTTRSAVSR